MVIPITKSIENIAYYVMLKGLDPDDYGINSIRDLTNKQIMYSSILKNNPSLTKAPNYIINKL